MNSSLRTANRLTHVKVVAVALIAAIAVVLVGTSAHVINSTETTLIARDRVVVKAAKPSILTMKDTATTR
jgi:hypothetical protein